MDIRELINNVYAWECVKYMAIHGITWTQTWTTRPDTWQRVKIRETRHIMRGYTWEHLGIHRNNTNIREHVRENTRGHTEWRGKAVEMPGTARDPK